MTDTPWHLRRLVVVDVETTGLDADCDRIIEIGAVHFEGGEVVERYQQLVHPGCDIPPEVVEITGIQPADLEGQPTFADVAADVYSHLSRGIPVAYNLPFDRGFLEAELRRAGLAWPDVPGLDPLVFARQLHRGLGSKKLGAVAERLGVSLDNAHRAVHDAEAAGRVLLAFAPQLPADLADLLELQGQWERQQAMEQERWRRNKERSAGDGLLAGSAAAPERTEDGLLRLGAAYVWGEETDPIRALFASLPDAGATRRS